MSNMNPCYNPCNSYPKWAIGNDLRAIMLQDEDIVSMVGSNIYPLIAPENVKGPFIVYVRDKYSKHSTKMGTYEDDCKVGIVAISDNYDDAVKLAQNIDGALTGGHTSTDGINITIDLEDSSESFEDNKYVETLLFSIK